MAPPLLVGITAKYHKKPQSLWRVAALTAVLRQSLVEALGEKTKKMKFSFKISDIADNFGLKLCRRTNVCREDLAIPNNKALRL